MLGKNVTKLIIVCDEKTKEYANFLRQLISVNDDKDDDVVGIVDGSVDAAVWLEKEYLANSATVSSNEHVLFVGNFKTSKSEMSSMKVKCNSYGMKYGWLGKRAMMQVEDTLLSEFNYNAFIAFCIDYEQRFEKLAYPSLNKSLILGVTRAGANAKLPPVVDAGFLAVEVYNELLEQSLHKKIKDQQYRALTVIFYRDGLKEFLEG